MQPYFFSVYLYGYITTTEFRTIETTRMECTTAQHEHIECVESWYLADIHCATSLTVQFTQHSYETGLLARSNSTNTFRTLYKAAKLICVKNAENGSEVRKKDPWLWKDASSVTGVIKHASRWSKMCRGNNAMTLPEYYSSIHTSQKWHVRKEKKNRNCCVIVKLKPEDACRVLCSLT